MKRPAKRPASSKRPAVRRKAPRETDGMMELPGGEVLQGHFRDGLPHGRCEYFDPEDQTTLVGIYNAGQLNGPAVQLDDAQRLVFCGSFQNDLRVGLAQVFDEYGGCVMGEVDGCGEHSGDNLMYVFPDGLTALVGTFHDGEFRHGRYAMLQEPMEVNSSLEAVSALKMPGYVFSEDISTTVHRDVSSKDKLCDQPLVQDLYEYLRVEDMDGLFARRKLEAGELCSWYNGLRCTHEEVDGREWRLNDATITLDAETVLDVPAEFVPADAFTACLGHKANHRKPNNAKYDVFDHPRYGLIKAIRALSEIAAGEEIFCDYAYEGDPEDLPAWYADTGIQPKS